MAVKNTISLRVHYPTWVNEERCRELLELLRAFRGTIEEVAFFTSDTHPPLPLAEVRRRAAILARVIPEFKAIGLRTGINHLATIGHLDENPENSLAEPWQRLTDMSGSVSSSCYCPADPQVADYVTQSYAALAGAGPEFIWVDDDVRMEHHPKGVTYGCFCPFCLADFSAETGTAWTREALLAGFKTGPRENTRALRRLWVEHSRRYIERILSLAREAADGAAPGISLGFMTGEISYSGFGYESWTKAMAGSLGLAVKFRPGGGFYSDETPLALPNKCHSVGRQNAFVPASVTDIQYEHENFPYVALNKSRTIFTAEMAGAIAAGCTGTALNVLGISGDPLDEYRPYFEAVRAARPFLDELAAVCGRSPCEGIWAPFGTDYIASMGPDGDWPGPGSWGGDFHGLNEIFTLGLPPAYARGGASMTLLTGDHVLEWPVEQLREWLSGGVLLDGPALQRLSELGLADLTGWELAGGREKDTLERFTSDPLNGRFAGWRRDCRPSFWPHASFLLRPTDPAARPLGHSVDFTPTDYGCSSGVFENRLGGRVAVFGYYPWMMLGGLAKTAQFRNVARWVSRDRLPAYIASAHRVSLWCRRDADGHAAFVLLNTSLDPAENVILNVRNSAGSGKALDAKGVRSVLPAGSADGAYRALHVPTLAPWSALLVRA